ncbi:MAG: hypothetical protein AB7W37_07615 [Syntrophobacteraceae bacterium]
MRKIYQAMAYLQLALTLAMTSGCATDGATPASPFAQSYHDFFTAQVVNPLAPNDRSGAETLPGKISAGVFEKRYTPNMTEKESKDDNSNKMESQFKN